MNVGDWTASHVGATPWRTGQPYTSPSWMVGHLRVPPSWNWARWWAKGSLQVMCCVGTAPVRFSVQLVLIGIALVLKVVNWGPRIYRVFARSKLQKAAGCPCESGTFSGRCL